MRIHSYGYDSDYLSGKGDVLNVHHFGKAFLGEVSISPYIAQSRTSIVIVGHSMGGLVIKKTIILARQNKAHQALARRIAAVYFLATPHHGASSARILRNILRPIYHRGYVADLERNSGSIQVINDEFRKFAADLELWSFAETQKMKFFKSLVVDTESAVLGYREESQMRMAADHRSICKFESQFDPNYVILRSALASTVGRVSQARAQLDKEGRRSQLRDVQKYLDVSEKFEMSLTTARDAQYPDRVSGLRQKIDMSGGEMDHRGTTESSGLQES